MDQPIFRGPSFLATYDSAPSPPPPPPLPPTVSGPATNSKTEKERQFGDGKEGDGGRGRARSLLLYKHSILSGRDPFSLFLKINILDTKIQIQIVDKIIVEMPVGRLKQWL